MDSAFASLIPTERVAAVFADLLALLDRVGEVKHVSAQDYAMGAVADARDAVLSVRFDPVVSVHEIAAIIRANTDEWANGSVTGSEGAARAIVERLSVSPLTSGFYSRTPQLVAELIGRRPWSDEDAKWDAVRAAWTAAAEPLADDAGRIDLTDVDGLVEIAVRAAIDQMKVAPSDPSVGMSAPCANAQNPPPTKEGEGL